MAIPNLFVLNNSGDVLIEKQFLGSTKRYVCELFWEEVQKYDSQKQICPIITTENYYLLNVRRSSLFFLSAVTKDVTPLLVFEAMHKIIDVLLFYFNGKITGDTLRENFAIVYQLFDELIVGGFLHTTEMNQLVDMISPPTTYKKIQNMAMGNFVVKGTLPSAFNNPKMPWRKPDCKYVTNEIKIDVIESLEAIIHATNVSDKPVTTTIAGSLECNVHLSQQPDLTLCFNNPRMLDHIQLHRCVRISRWQKEKVISFVPPDGRFTLARYRIQNAGLMPLIVHPSMELSAKAGNVKITIKKQATQGKQVDKLALEIPFPKETMSFQLTGNVGKVSQDEITKVVRWTIGKFPKDKDPELEGTVTLSSDFVGVAKPVIRCGFEIKGLSLANLRVDSLAVHNVKYKPFKGVRHIVKASNFLVRTA